VGFEQDVRPLFRARDREEMEWLFDLWRVEDVRKHAEAVLARLEDGSMPCDGAWPDEQVDVFRRWIAAGMPD
jgi:hypothetical protein